MGFFDFLGKNKITMGLFKMSFKKMNDTQKEEFIYKAIDKLALGEEKLPDNPQMAMIINQWKGMRDWDKKQMVKMIAPKMSEAIEKGEFDQMMGGMG